MGCGVGELEERAPETTMIDRGPVRRDGMRSSALTCVSVSDNWRHGAYPAVFL